MDQPVILVEGLWAGYERDDDILEDVNLRVGAGDFVGIIGPNGGGKTTLLRVLLGILPPTRGHIEIMGQPPARGRRHIGYVPQHFSLDTAFPMAARDVVRMGRLNRRGLFRRYAAEDDAAVDRALDQVEMREHADAQVADLSGGQRQRVYIARALATEPSILLLDEPTASVDPRVRTSIFELLRELNGRVSILLISHDMAAISSYVKSVGCLNRHLFYQNDRNLTEEMLELAYQCPVDLIAHGVPHRVFGHHHDHELDAVEKELA